VALVVVVAELVVLAVVANWTLGTGVLGPSPLSGTPALPGAGVRIVTVRELRLHRGGHRRFGSRRTARWG
jgi:hypothetical protein